MFLDIKRFERIGSNDQLLRARQGSDATLAVEHVERIHVHHQFGAGRFAVLPSHRRLPRLHRDGEPMPHLGRRTRDPGEDPQFAVILVQNPISLCHRNLPTPQPAGFDVGVTGAVTVTVVVLTVVVAPDDVGAVEEDVAVVEADVVAVANDGSLNSIHASR